MLWGGTQCQRKEKPRSYNALRGFCFYGAAEWNRTIDLTLTKGTLYRLSYGSKFFSVSVLPDIGGK